MDLIASGLIVKNCSLAPFTSWKVGGKAEFFSQPSSEAEIRDLVEWATLNGCRITCLGGGTNVLVSDLGVPGLTISLDLWSEVETEKTADGKLELTVRSGTPKMDILKIFLKHKLQAALFIAGLPGNVGGGVAMNAGVSEDIYPKEFVDIVSWVEVMSLAGGRISVTKISAADLKWSYRHCQGWQPGIILRVGISTENNPDPATLDKVRKANQIRAQKQPLNLPSCGSVFRNPPGQRAGLLIESCGLKGFQIGDAQVSTKHANFIVNLGAATALDLWRVMTHVQDTVLKKTSIALQTEVVRLGDWP